MAQSLREMNSVLANGLGLDDGFRLPVANYENKKLEEKYLELQKQKTTLQVHLNEENDRVKDIESHAKNVKNEITFIQMLLLAKGKEVNDEDNLMRTKSRECKKMEQEILKINKKVQDLKEKENGCENSMFKLNQNMEERKQQMDWDQQTLENWFEECKRRDDNITFLEKYSRQDEAKIKELSMKVTNLTVDCLTHKTKLDQEAVETQAAQYGLDKIANDYRRSHQERKELVQRWQQTLEQLQKKDLEMDELSLKIREKKREVKLKEADVRDTEEFLESEKKSNEEVDSRIKMAEVMQAKRRQFMIDLETAKVNASGELLAIKQELERTANDLESCRGQIKMLKQEVLIKRNKLSAITNQLEDLRNQEKSQSEGAVDAESRTKRMEELMEEEEKMQRRLEEEIKTLNFQLFKKQQVVQELATKKKNFEGDIQSSQVTIKNLSQRMEKLNQESTKQTKLIYNQDYRIQELNKKLSKLQGDVSMEEEDVHGTRIKMLEDELDKRNKLLQFTLNQHQRINDDIRKLKQECDKLKYSGSDYSKKSQELQLKIEVTGKALKELIGQKQDKMVYENLKKFELKRLRNMLFKRAKDNMSVEKELALMRAAMEERRQEIGTHKSLLLAELKMLEEELRRTNVELQEKVTKVDQLKKRYDIVVMKMTPNEGEETVLGYLIRATQEMEELRLRGDELNSKIISKEQELLAFENTVALVAGRNELQRSAIRGVPANHAEQGFERQGLEDKFKKVADRLKVKKQDCNQLLEENQELGARLQDLREESFYTEEDLTRKKQELLKLKKELTDQHTKLERVARMNTKLSKDLANSMKDDLSDKELDITIRELKEVNNMVAKEINVILSEYPSLQNPIRKYFEEANIRLSEAQLNPRSSSLLSLRTSQGLTQKLSSSRMSSPKVNTVSVTIKDATPQFEDKTSRPTSIASRQSTSRSNRSQSSKK